nr:sigma-70 family RNA polymerase sigma factor [Roseicitreum antarcticum]
MQDRSAFRTLYSASASKLLGVLVRMLGNRAEAEDALQEVFTRIWLNAHKFDPDKGGGMGWLITIARNHAIDRLRTRKPEAQRRTRDDGDTVDPVDMLADPTPGVEAMLATRGDMQRVVECFGTLEREKSAAVKGAYLEGLSYQDLSERFNVPLNTMRSWLRRSLLQLRECLDQ